MSRFSPLCLGFSPLDSLKTPQVLGWLSGQFLFMTPGEQVFQLVSGFPYGTTASYEDAVSTIPVNFSVS